MPAPPPSSVAVARQAMATRFEIVLQGGDPVRLRAAGEEALDEVERLEGQLSLYRPTSSIANCNTRAAHEPVRIEPEVFRLLEHARRLHRDCGGVFDPTVGPLMKCWGFVGGTGRLPDPAALAAARQCVGMEHVHLDAEGFSVRFDRPGVMLDLGAIGKGYALERAAGLLREAGVRHALLHGGTSTIFALGPQADGGPWKIAIEHPATPLLGEPHDPLTVVALQDEALSVSAVWGKSFQTGSRLYGHVIDPRSGEPVTAAVMAAVVLSSATETDALSTALLTVGPAGHDAIAALRTGLKSLVVGSPNAEAVVRLAATGMTVPARLSLRKIG
jgi:FAD:protein FMN transferase